MTRLQATYLILRPRDPKGGILPYGPPRSALRRLAVRPDARERYRALGLEEWQVAALVARDAERTAAAYEAQRQARQAHREGVKRNGRPRSDR